MKMATVHKNKHVRVHADKQKHAEITSQEWWTLMEFFDELQEI